MKRNQQLIQWLIPSAFLFVTILVMFMLFSAKATQSGTQMAENVIAMQDEKNAANIATSLSKIQTATKITADLNEQYGNIHNMNKNLAKNILAETDAYMVVICDETGEGITQDGKAVHLGNSAYFEQLAVGWNYVADDGVNFASALAYAAENDNGYYTISYINSDAILKLLQKEGLYASTFYVILDKDWNMLVQKGSNNTYLKENNLWNTLKSENANKSEIKQANINMANNSSGVMNISLEGEGRAIAYAPILNDELYLLTGVEEAYIETQAGKYYSSAKMMLISMVVILAVFFILVIVINVSYRSKFEVTSEELQQKADTDLLTDLTNKLATERMIKEFIQKNPDGTALFFIVDIDNFKKINDTLGHAFGDEVLRTLGHQLRAAFRADDIVGRVGGDEFLILVKNIDTSESFIHKEADRLDFLFKNFQAGEYVKYSATASIGASLYPKDAQDFEGLYKAADLGLYEAKKRGKNQICFYDEQKEQKKSE